MLLLAESGIAYKANLATETPNFLGRTQQPARRSPPPRTARPECPDSRDRLARYFRK